MWRLWIVLGLALGVVWAEGARAAAEVGSGRTEAAQNPQANKRLVLDFWRVVIETRDMTHAADFLAPDFIQHNPTMADGIKGFAVFAETRWKGLSPRPVEPLLRNPPAFVLADGDLVQLVFRRPTVDPSRPGVTYDRYTFDLYRVAGDKIVEHWDNVPKPTPP